MSEKMTLEEAIIHLEETLSDKNREWSCDECRQEHIQLLGWLRELQRLREGCEMSSFDYDIFTGEYPIAVSKERYTFHEALDIAISGLGTENLEVKEMFVRYGFGVDEDSVETKPQNNWWLELDKPIRRGCPVWAFRKRGDE